MGAGDSTIVSFTAGDEAAATTAFASLAPAATDKIVTWQHNNLVFVAKVLTA